MSVVNSESDKKDWPKDKKLAYCYGLWEQYKESSEEVKFVAADEPKIVTAEEK